jgi:hypothetical protein
LSAALTGRYFFISAAPQELAPWADVCEPDLAHLYVLATMQLACVGRYWGHFRDTLAIAFDIS